MQQRFSSLNDSLSKTWPRLYSLLSRGLDDHQRAWNGRVSGLRWRLFRLYTALLGILAQRLTRRLCSDCKEAYAPDAVEVNNFVREYCAEMVKEKTPAEAEEIYERTRAEWQAMLQGGNEKFTLYRAKGCAKCEQTGYRGRVGLHELLIGTDPVKRDILNHAPVSTLLQTALSEGMRTLRQDGIEKVIQGLTDILQIRAVCSK